MIRKKIILSHDEIFKCYLSLGVHCTPAGKWSISKATLASIPNHCGTILDTWDLGDRIFFRVLGLEEHKIALPKQGIILPTGTKGPRDVRPIIKLPD